MHSAPSVLYPLGRSRFQALILFGVWLVGFLLISGWWWALQRLDWRTMVGVIALLLAAVGAFISWKNTPEGQLGWDGQVWHWQSRGYQSGTAVNELAVLADFQSMLLLRLENQAHATLWLWALKSSHPERWSDLRRAVYARPAPPQPTVQGLVDELETSFPVAVSVSADRDVVPSKQ